RSGGRGGERRAVVWPVSWLVRGRAWPGGRTLALRRPGRSCPALMGPAWPPGLARRGTRARQVGKELNDAAPPTDPFYGQRPGGTGGSGVVSGWPSITSAYASERDQGSRSWANAAEAWVYLARSPPSGRSG